MSIATEITRLQGAKSDLKTSIEGKGVTVPSATKIDGYAALVDQIQQGGGGSLPVGGTKGMTLVKQSSVDGDADWADLYKWGVISQTQTWTGTTSTGYDYTMSNPVYGYIPQANIDLYTAAGATFNAVSGYFELNGLTDISYNEMNAIYAASIGKDANPFLENAFANIQIRTNFSLFKSGLNMYGSANTEATRLTGVAFASPIEVFCYRSSDQKANSKIISNVQMAFAQNWVGDASYLKTILGILCVTNISSFWKTFEYCWSLENVQLLGMKANCSFQHSSRLTAASVAYMINNAGTANFTITLHATAYSRAMADSSVTTALASHTNVTLASA